MVITEVIRNDSGKVIFVRFSDFASHYIATPSLLAENSRYFEFENAVVTFNGVVRAKPGCKIKSVSGRYEDYISLAELCQSQFERLLTKTPLRRFRNRKIYDGKSNKFGVTLDGVNYIVKTQKSVSDSSVYGEHVASTFMRVLGYNVQGTCLCLDESGSVVVVVRDFVGSDESLRSFKDVRQTSEDTDIGSKSYTYNDVLYLISKHSKLIDKDAAIRQFWDMYMLDAVLANRDRHHGNWGYIVGRDSYRIAGIYDNGACLYPDVLKKIAGYKSDRRSFLYDRCEKFPASLLVESIGSYNKRTNYYEYIGRNDRTSEMNEAYLKLFNISDSTIYKSAVYASSCILIPRLLRSFYRDIIYIRYMHIIRRLPFDECFRRLKSYEEALSDNKWNTI